MLQHQLEGHAPEEIIVDPEGVQVDVLETEVSSQSARRLLFLLQAGGGERGVGQFDLIEALRAAGRVLRCRDTHVDPLS